MNPVQTRRIPWITAIRFTRGEYENRLAERDLVAEFRDPRSLALVLVSDKLLRKDFMKPNCYDCIHGGNVPGSAHYCCNHPDTADVKENSLAQLVGMLGGGLPLPSKAWSTLRIVGASHGVRNGWFGWPLNFDPVWLEHCDGFTAKTEGVK